MTNSRTRILWTLALATALATPALALDPAARLVPTRLLKGDPEATGPGIAPNLTGGPDAFGYTFIDSLEAGGPTFAFHDISGTGTAVLLGDDAGQSVPIGFSFPFYAAAFTDLFLDSNGYLSFDDGSTSGIFTNDCPFDPLSPPDVIAPYWDDLDPGDDGAAAFHQTFAVCPVGAGVQCAIFQWEEYDFFPGDGAPGGTAGTFQAILYADGDILFQYQGGPGLDGGGATVGINNDVGTGNSLGYGCNAPGSIAAGRAVLFEAPPIGDLEITKMGTVATGGPYTYLIVVTNNGPNLQTGVEVTDVLPAGLTFVGDTCGGSFLAGTWTWPVGNLANGSSASCDLTVELTGPACTTVTNTATVTGDLADPPGDNSATHSNGGGELVLDPGFEDGTPSTFWTEASTNFGTPVCDIANCGTGTGTGPNSGLFWTWFGGIAAFEEGSMTQDLVIPVGVTDLTFQLEAILCDDPADFVEVTIDATPVFTFTGAAPECGVLGYHQETVDISAFADGALHTLEFHSITFGTGVTNFFVDDVSIPSVPVCVQSASFDLELAKQGIDNGNGTGTYVLTVSNNGPDDATGVVVTDTLPAGVAPITTDCGAVYAAPTLTWNVGNLANGASETCNVDVTILNGADTLNDASVTGSGVDTDPANNTAAAVLGQIPVVLEVPALGHLGLGLLALLLAAGAVLRLRF